MPMKSAFTKTERLAAGLYVAVIAALTLTFITSGREPILIISTFISGFLGGLFILPAILIPDRFIVLRALVAGCIVTIFTAVLSSTFLALLFIYSPPDPSFASNWLSVISALMFCSLGAPATVLFSYFLRRGNRSEPKRRNVIIGWTQRLFCALSMSLPLTILIAGFMIYSASISENIICFLLFPGGFIAGFVVLPHYLSWKEKRHAYAGIGGALSLITAVIINYFFYILFDLIVSERFGDMFMDGGPFTEALFFLAFGFCAFFPFGLFTAGGDYLYYNHRKSTQGF